MDQEVKYHAPSNIATHEPYESIWVAELEDGIKIWIQSSKDSNNPKWIRYGDYIEQDILQGGNFLERAWAWHCKEKNKKAKE